MVDAVVSFVVQRLGDLLIEQVFLQEVRDDVEWLKNKLEYMLCFLTDAVEKQDDHHILTWISKIRDVAYDTENIIDNIILEVEEGRAAQKMGLKGWLERYLCICSKQASLVKQHGIGFEINSLKNRLEEIQRDQEIFKITNIGNVGENCTRMNELLNYRRRRPYEDNELVVGFEKDVDLLMSELMKKEPHRCEVLIVGMGGLGIARKLYNSLGDRFNFLAWVSVSKDYNIRDLLQRLVKSFKTPNDKQEFKMLEKMMKEEDLKSYLHNLLNEDRYFVVLDDVWNVQAWQSLRGAFPENKNGSRIIITTREKDVANIRNDRTYVHELQNLTEVESWELFCKSYKNRLIPPDLESMAKYMVKKCHGSPLAIIALGGVLSSKHTDEWPKVQNYFWRYVREDHNDDFQRILVLSFNNLHHQLKFCFLYLGLFAEDTIFDVKQLYCLWMAEGFIKLGDESEKVAAEYLKELIDKNLIQIVNRRESRIISCRIHYLLHDFAIKKSMELNFLHIYDRAVDQKSRRLASHCGFQRFVLDYLNLHLRSFLVFNPKNESTEIEQLRSICMKLRLLRVLYLEGRPLNTCQQTRKTRLADAIGKLIHLRYLRLNVTNINDLSPFIGNLQALQTLEIGGSVLNPISLPDEICKLKQLRHLLGAFKWPFRVDNLTKLRTLTRVVVEGQMEFNPMNLINLRELSVVIVGRSNRFTLDSIGRLRSLQLFGLYARYVREESFPLFPPLQPLSHYQHLLEMTLWNYHRLGWTLPIQLHEFLPNLKYLGLEVYSMLEDPMTILEKFPNLTFLELELYGVDKLTCNIGGFPQLKFLRIYESDVKELLVEEGGMPLLNGLTVEDSVKIPERLRSIPAIPWINK